MQHGFVESPAPLTESGVRTNRSAELSVRAPSTPGWWLALQRAAGNRAVAGLVPAVQRCGGEVHEGCACADPEAVQLTLDPGGDVAVQRDDPKDPTSLAGTPFDSFDATLKEKLKDQAIFSWGAPTLAESLGKLSNADVAVIARIGSMISLGAPFLWKYVAWLGRGGWITDNFGMRIGWTDPGGVEAELVANPNFCKDNPVTAKWYHGTTSAFRQIPAAKAAPSMHVVTAGTTEVHIDAHQPVEGKEDSWPWAGQCNYDVSAWVQHAGDVGGGGGGARATPLGRYSALADGPNRKRKDMNYEKADEPKLVEVEQILEKIWRTVQKYAALGKMVGNEFEGDQQMAADTATMDQLKRGEDLISDVAGAQHEREAMSEPAGP